MKKVGILGVAVVWMAVSVGFAGISPQQKVMAKRAAEVDAYRNMAERIMGLRVTSETTVRDFVTESDKIALSMDHFVKGLAIDDSKTIWLSDGSCEVVVEVTLSKVVQELQTTCDQYYKGDKWTKVIFEKMTTHTQERTLTEVGSGAVRDSSIIPEPKSVPVVMQLINPRDRETDLPAIYSQYPAKNRLMAKRIATADAYRKLAERVYGLRINATTTVNDFIGEDVIRTKLEQELCGVKVTDVRYQEDGIVEVQVTMTIKQVVSTIKKVLDEYYNETGKKIKSESFEEVEKANKYRTIAVIGMGSVDQQSAPQTPPSTGDIEATRGGRRTVTVEIIAEGPEVIEIK